MNPHVNINLLIAYVIHTDYNAVVNYLRSFGIYEFNDINRAVLYTLKTYDEAMESFLDLHPDREIILELYGSSEGETVALDKLNSHKKKEGFTINFTMKECMIGLVGFFLLMLFVTSKRS